MGRMFFPILDAIAAFEHALMNERTLDGLSAAPRPGGRTVRVGCPQIQIAGGTVARGSCAARVSIHCSRRCAAGTAVAAVTAAAAGNAHGRVAAEEAGAAGAAAAEEAGAAGAAGAALEVCETC
jgi:energy-converting hydrogenase Eha subunit B